MKKGKPSQMDQITKKKKKKKNDDNALHQRKGIERLCVKKRIWKRTYQLSGLHITIRGLEKYTKRINKYNVQQPEETMTSLTPKIALTFEKK